MYTAVFWLADYRLVGGVMWLYCRGGSGKLLPHIHWYTRGRELNGYFTAYNK